MTIISTKYPILIDLFNYPECAENLSELQWDLVVRQAKAANLLARLSWLLKEQGSFKFLPVLVKRHFDSEEYTSQAVKRSSIWEVERIYEALESLNIRVLLVKGAAYSVMGLAASIGRVYQDIDILVPKSSLDNVENMLMWYGWTDREVDQYEQQYYRKWMHELPPKYHNRRGTVLDVHHNILPETCKLCPDASLILEAAQQIPETHYWVPCPEDLVIHSATHLFHEGEYGNGLRDLSDLNLLITEFSSDKEFWNKLLSRGISLGLGRPLFYALRYTKLIFHTNIPNQVTDQVEQHKPYGFMVEIMDFLFIRALMPDHASCNDRWTLIARWLLYIRSHWLRMPIKLLTPHLLRKCWLRITVQTEH